MSVAQLQPTNPLNTTTSINKTYSARLCRSIDAEILQASKQPANQIMMIVPSKPSRQYRRTLAFVIAFVLVQDSDS